MNACPADKLRFNPTIPHLLTTAKYKGHKELKRLAKNVPGAKRSQRKPIRTKATWTYCSEKHFLKLDVADFFFANLFFALFCKIRVSGKEQVSSCWSSRSGGNTDVATSRRRRRRPRNDFPGSVFIFSVIFWESRPADFWLHKRWVFSRNLRWRKSFRWFD